MKRYTSILISLLILPSGLRAQLGLWSNYVNVSNNSGGSKWQNLAIDSDNHLHLVWEDHTAYGGLWGDILYSCFNGQNWSMPELVSFPYANYSWLPRLDVDSVNMPHVVWVGNANVNGIIYYASLDSGGAWSAPLDLSAGAVGNGYPDIVTDSQNRLHVVWNGGIGGYGHIIYRCFDGTQWLPFQDLTPQSVENCSRPRICLDAQSRLHVVYVAEENTYPTDWDIMYLLQDDSGWSQPVNITTFNEKASLDPDLSLDDSDNPHVVWRQLISPPNNDQIYYCYFDGQVWTPPENLTNLQNNYYLPAISISAAMKFVSFSCHVPVGYDIIEYTIQTGTFWSEPDTLLLIPENHLGWTTSAFDTSDHLQIVSSPYLGPFNTELYHQTYINSPDMLPTELTPYNLPITIPSSGGSFNFDVQISNQAILPVTFDAWIDAILPSGSIYGPILLRQNLILSSGGVVFRQHLTQNIPGSAPAGEYFYRLHAGDLSDAVVVSSDSFSFVKEGVSISTGGLWLLDGWNNERPHMEQLPPESSNLLSPSPNPFNPTTVISYQLGANSLVSLKVYNTAGRLVATLVEGWREAGRHSATFDGAAQASGVYICRIQAGDFEANQKMLLLK